MKESEIDQDALIDLPNDATLTVCPIDDDKIFEQYGDTR
jgi:hypothetical protein